MATNQKSNQKGKARGVYLSDELWTWLKAQAAADSRPLSSFIALRLEELKNKTTKKAK